MRIMVCPEEESILMSSMVETLARLHGQTMTERSEYDFDALRLDWFRLQTLTSVNKAPLRSDIVLGNLVSICQSISSFPILSAWDHTFVPREYLVAHLEDLFMKRVFAMMRYNMETHDIARPSEVLARIQSYMSALRTLELYVTIDMTRVLTAVLLQETQMLDSKGEATLASTYTAWYTNTLLKRVAVGGVCYSVSRKCFVSKAIMPFKAEEYTDITGEYTNIRV
ncbi:Nck-associated protein 1 homolog [Geodia barretti]|uniref:Nck-associated protein 1 homolog n=1 Tax=Geodia barretti TaxID=519541 RepID=A0AA35W7E0_GEOBA|nr:Nck-associated protein 1 homolog [Geodia barretti]